MYLPEASNYSQFMKSGNTFMRFFSNSFYLNHIQNFAILCPHCGRSSVVERHVANVNVEGSSPFARFVSRRFGFFRSAFFISLMHDVAGVGLSNGREKVKRSAERVAPVAQTTHPTRAGLAWVLNSLCGATLSATREFVKFAWVLNSLVVPLFLRRGNLQQERGCSTRLWCNTFCDVGICNGCVGA